METVTKVVMLTCLVMAVVMFVASVALQSTIVAVWACFMALMGIWFSLE